MTKKYHNLIIRFWFRKEMEKRYGHKLQKIYKTLGFKVIKNYQLENLNQAPLETVFSKAKKLALIMTSLVFGISLILKNPLTSHLALIKFLAILIIICRSDHWNKNNYISLLVQMYIYSADAKNDTISFFNHFGLFILYNVFLRKVRVITISSAIFIKK